MSKQEIVNQYQESAKVKQILNQIQRDNNHIQITNLVGSSMSFVISETFKKDEKSYLLIFNDKEEAAYHLNDLEQLLDQKRVLFYPGSYRRPYQIDETDNANVLMRSEVLNRINSRKKPVIIVTYPEALFEKVVTKKDLEKNTLKLAVSEKVSLDFVNEILFEYNFNRVDFVTEPGDFSVRGGIIDVFSFSNDEPFRIEFFGDEIDSIRTFDVETQLSKQKLRKASIMSNVENKTLQEKRESFLKYISSNTVIFLKNKELLIGKLDTLFSKAELAFSELSEALKHAKPIDLFCKGSFIQNQLSDFTVAHFETYTSGDKPKIDFCTKAQPSFNKQFDLLINNLNGYHTKGFTNYIFCANEQQAQRFHDIFEDAKKQVHYQTVVFSLHQGFIDLEEKIVCYTDHQIFERYHKFRLKNGYAKKQSISLKELNNLDIGDYVTHIDHGIGKFGGLQKINVEGKNQEAIKLIYGDRDILYVSIHSLHKISKFNGKDGKAPKIYKLGSGAWKKVKQKTKKRVKEIAYNLIKLYAKRKMRKGLAFGPDTHIQHELEASFIFEDTPDQFTATQDVKADMEKEQPMDRLVCGDVGFGKTEIAIRAAFKAVDNGKQVAILVPTTILAFQHYKTFTKRLENFPVRIDYLNRFRTTKQKNEAIEGVNDGSIDIIIGTHQLTNKKIKFKDLGLLIIDEEQKFGVAVKDKLKTIKENVDTLTLTATPIPRTLQFSLMAARDLSVISTPPPNRHPIDTQVIRFSEEIIRDAINYEISRGGQVFFIHNRIENIKEVAGLLQRLIPNANIAVGHGQMEGKKLESLMLGFMNNEFDVLVSTTIVESGLDVTNANTILINNANNFGLSDLHQMRGRVGRSNKKAFCYFITPPYHLMTNDARKRIEALELFSDLGSGINIAMKDLEIRGAGDLLGGEQSGFINDIGFDTYQKILSEAIEELKENEFKDLYKTEENKPKEFIKEVQIDTDFEILFPDNYINSITERLNLYNELSTLKSDDELQHYEQRLTDRFGELPFQAIDLLDSVRLKWYAKKLGVEKIVLKQKRMIGYFIADQQSEFYQTKAFTRVLKHVQQNPTTCVIKEKQTKIGLRLLITFIKIDSVATALKKLKQIANTT
ncbi:MAG: transcription-repair coupling factor [Flavobacteriaceae bacterium]